MVLKPKSNLGGYPLILGSHVGYENAYIGYRSRDMTISHRNYTKNITLYPPTNLPQTQKYSMDRK
jgi:hypothetical protein